MEPEKKKEPKGPGQKNIKGGERNIRIGDGCNA